MTDSLCNICFHTETHCGFGCLLKMVTNKIKVLCDCTDSRLLSYITLTREQQGLLLRYRVVTELSLTEHSTTFHNK